VISGPPNTGPSSSGPSSSDFWGSGPVVSSKLELRATARKGRGVFAAAAIDAGELLETSPGVALDRHDTETIVGTTLDNYYFAHPTDPDGGLLVFGLSSLVNHSDAPNVDIVPRQAGPLGWLVELRALREIAPGEELTHRYACELWFEPEPPAISSSNPLSIGGAANASAASRARCRRW
jgi:SET domain-containing protein